MKSRSLHIYSLIGLLCLGLLSCQKENDTYPTISIIGSLSSSYDFGDTIKLSFSVADLDGSIRIHILDGSTVFPVTQELLFSDNVQYDYALYLDDRNLPSGEYEVRIQAFNGENRTAAFLDFDYVELPRYLRGVAFLSGDNTLGRYDSLGQIGTAPLPGSYSFLTFNSRQQRIAVAASQQGALSGFTFDDLSQAFQLPEPPDEGLGLYATILNSEQHIYAAESGGRIQGLAADGSIARSFNLQDGYIPIDGTWSTEGILMAVQEEGKELYRLLLISDLNGALLKQTTVNGKVSALEYAGQQRFSVFYSRNGDSYIATYDLTTNVLTNLAQFPGEQPLSLLRISDGDFLLSTDNGTYRFNPHSSQFPQLLFTFAATDMEYDELSNSLYFASGRDVFLAPLGAASTLLFSSPTTINQIELVYNK